MILSVCEITGEVILLRFLILILLLTPIAIRSNASVPVDGGLGLQPAATRLMERHDWFHTYSLVWITLITLFVLGLLVYVIYKFNKTSNPEPSRFSHNVTLEIVWTIVPVFILVAIAIPSFGILYYQDRTPVLSDIVAKAETLRKNSDEGKLRQLMRNHNPVAAAKGWINVKVQGNQWNWTYIYPDELDESGYPLEFVSNGLHRGQDSDARPTKDRPRYLAADYPMVIPVNRYIRYYTAATDVIHSWAVPAFGIKMDAVPGKSNQGWFLVNQTGVFYGQCSELCGKDHAFMPIEVRVVSQRRYDSWLNRMKNGDYDGARSVVADLDSDENEPAFARLIDEG